MAPLEQQRNSTVDAFGPVRSEPFPPGTSIARYRLISLIGSGAMGDVYRAHDRALDREVALKVLPPELTGDRDRVHRFAHEARSTSALSHPHIVAIHEVGHARPLLSVRAIGERAQRAGEVHYISMELIDGRTLREALTTALPLRERIELLRERIELMVQVADGLAKAHAANILHRDLKPDNILVSRDGYAKIVDFGLAKLIDTTWNPIGADSPTLRALTAHGELLGTPGYMAPEQVAGKPLDARADIFAFGCMLYEAISGMRAFEGENFVDTLYKIIHDEPAPLPDAPPELQRIVTRCLEKHREDRYQSIRDVAADLRAWNAGVPPADPTPSRRRVNPLIILAASVLPILAFILLRTPTPEPPQPAVRRITAEGHASHVAISPDGRYVAYITSDAKGRTLWIEQVASGRTLIVVPASKAHYAGLAFSRDGQFLYYTRYDSSLYAALHRISILGGDPQVIIRDIDTRAAISPDGTRIAFARDNYQRGTTSLMVANADGTNERPLAVLRLPDRILSPAWSPDGDAIAIAHETKLLVVSYPRGGARTITTSAHLDDLRGLSWPARDRLVVAASNDESAGRFRLWNIDPSGGKATPMTNELTDLYAPAVSDDGAIAALQVIRQANLFEADGEGHVQQLTSGIGAGNGLTGVAWIGDRVVYASAADGKHDLWTIRAKERDVTRLTDDASLDARPATAPDGSAIYYLSGSQQRHAIWRVRPDGSERRQMTSGPRDGSFAISPDSRTIAWASLDPRTTAWELWIMPANGGPKRRLAGSPSMLENVRWMPDGKSILFTAYDQSTMRVYRVATAGGPAKPLTSARSFSASISPDGRTIACGVESIEDLSAPLALIDAQTGAMRRLELNGGLYRWHPSGRAISFIREEDDRTDLWLQPLDGTPARRLTRFGEGTIADYAWNATGTRVVVAHVQDTADVVLMR